MIPDLLLIGGGLAMLLLGAVIAWRVPRLRWLALCVAAGGLALLGVRSLASLIADRVDREKERAKLRREVVGLHKIREERTKKADRELRRAVDAEVDVHRRAVADVEKATKGRTRPQRIGT